MTNFWPIVNFIVRWIPGLLFLMAGYRIPFLKRVAGLLICIGFRTKEALIAFGLLLAPMGSDRYAIDYWLRTREAD